MDRRKAEKELFKIFGIPSFHDLQWEVISNVFKGSRVLFIAKTGFGKSLCYQFPATQLDGLTIVFSPLIALMRDQVQRLNKCGIRAEAINSNQLISENKRIIRYAQNNELDLLYIAPERMENADWIPAAKGMKIGMIVVDEAHCISTWGHSFRPNYKRIVNLVNLLPENFPVLATTATATSQIQKDIESQIGNKIKTIRGSLNRPNLCLYVVRLKSDDEKFIWLANFIKKLGTPGIVYTGTQYESEIYSNWLNYNGINSTYYNGRLNAETRKSVEANFMTNQIECVVSTNALGMGIDKSDIRYIIHTQIPQSPIYYYQEIGRAGRDGEKSFCILLYNKKNDNDLPLSFIESSKPSIEKYEKIMAVTKKELLGRNEIVKKVNMKLTEVQTILFDLVNQNILNEQRGSNKKYFYNPNAPAFNYSVLEKNKKSQFSDFEKMLNYVQLKTCRLDYLCNFLGDEESIHCNKCDNDTGLNFSEFEQEDYIKKLENFKESFHPLLIVESRNSKMINGVAASYYGLSNVGKALKKSKYGGGGDFPSWILNLVTRAYKSHFCDIKFDLIVYVPPTESGDLVKNFSIGLSKELNLSISHDLIKTSKSRPQKDFNSALLKKENVEGNFAYLQPEKIAGKNILLVDDIYDSGHTIKEIGNLLTDYGINLVAPIVIAKTVGGDI